MGYYTQVWVDVKIPEDKIEEFNKKVKQLIQEAEKGNDEVEWILYYDDMKAEKDGEIVFDEYHRKWYKEEELYEFLASFNAEGTIKGRGEDFEDIWIVEFKNGKWNQRNLLV